MSLRDQIAGDAKIFLNPEEFGSPVTYHFEDGTTVETLAVIEKSTNNVEGSQFADLSDVYLLTSDVPEPGERDTFLNEGTTWHVDKVISIDAGITHVLAHANRRRRY